MKRIDERDTMFARASYRPGSRSYQDYYTRHPEKKAIDDAIRALPGLCAAGTATYHPQNGPIADAAFQYLADIGKYAEGPVAAEKVEVDAVPMTERLKGLAQYYGAVLVGVTEMKDAFYYSWRGRHEEVYGQEVKNKHRFAIVFAVEMAKDMINRAPQLAEVIETSKGYVYAATIGMILSYYIRSLGYAARNHMDANYLLVAPLVAQSAGLGELGRHGLLITKNWGSRVRLGVVTTDMPLVPDAPTPFGVQQFCEVCGKCARNCPARAIPSGAKGLVEGVERWQIKQEDCYRLWCNIGTDCGICIASCPFSQGLTKEEFSLLLEGEKGAQQALASYEQRLGTRRVYIPTPPHWLKKD